MLVSELVALLLELPQNLVVEVPDWEFVDGKFEPREPDPEEYKGKVIL